ncbi:MAG: methyltransferase domain-containing protein [Alphaproteobacteria bacterium]|nr:methyltransferase domain-containing protein [Alphaproteobacteria bacterium]
MALDVGRLRKKYEDSDLSYHITFLGNADQEVGVSGRTVLEVGGCLPPELVFGDFGAKRWIGVIEPEYYKETKTTFSSQAVQVVPIEQVKSLDDLGRHAVLLGRIEQLGPGFAEQFDMVFSVAAFEHITRLGLALDRIRMALRRDGGVLFTIFSPIWSAHDGHHLPEIVDSTGCRIDFGPAIPPWGHLLMRPAEMFWYLRRQADAETAAEVCYYIYNSPQINRLFTEDYVGLVAQDFDGLLEPLFPCEISAETQSRLETLYPGRTNFANNGIRMILRRKD